LGDRRVAAPTAVASFAVPNFAMPQCAIFKGSAVASKKRAVQEKK
jgi:hypothetical protein